MIAAVNFTSDRLTAVDSLREREKEQDIKRKKKFMP